MQPDNIIMGDATGIDLPQVQVDEKSLNEVKNKARYSKTREFKEIKAYCQSRIEFYQQKLPNGQEVGLEVVPSTEDWRVANRVIGEFKGLMNIYESAKDVLEDDKNAWRQNYQRLQYLGRWPADDRDPRFWRGHSLAYEIYDS